MMHKPEKDMVALIKMEINKFSHLLIDTVCLYSPGSMLDSSEIDEKTLEEIVALIKIELKPNRIVLEARPELINHRVLDLLQHLNKYVKIEINIPIESWKFITRRNLGKTFHNSVFSQISKEIKNIGCDFSTSVLLKPPQLNEYNAISEAIETIDWVSSLEPIHIVLEPIHVFSGTPLEKMYNLGNYLTPWWFSVYHVFLIAKNPLLKLGGEFLFPKPIAYPRGCNICTPAIIGLLRNEHYLTISNFPLSLSCKCKETWGNEIDYY